MRWIIRGSREERIGPRIRHRSAVVPLWYRVNRSMRLMSPMAGGRAVAGSNPVSPIFKSPPGKRARSERRSCRITLSGSWYQLCTGPSRSGAHWPAIGQDGSSAHSDSSIDAAASAGSAGIPSSLAAAPQCLPDQGWQRGGQGTPGNSRESRGPGKPEKLPARHECSPQCFSAAEPLALTKRPGVGSAWIRTTSFRARSRGQGCQPNLAPTSPG
jgi:hypothetical protein